MKFIEEPLYFHRSRTTNFNSSLEPVLECLPNKVFRVSEGEQECLPLAKFLFLCLSEQSSTVFLESEYKSAYCPGKSETIAVFQIREIITDTVWLEVQGSGEAP